MKSKKLTPKDISFYDKNTSEEIILAIIRRILFDLNDVYRLSIDVALSSRTEESQNLTNNIMNSIECLSKIIGLMSRSIVLKDEKAKGT